MTAFLLTLLASGYLLVSLLVLARRRPAYSHVEHTISELGEVGAADQRLASFGVFLPVGLALALAAWLLHPAHESSAMLALCLALGYSVAAIFPCDPGSPLHGSGRQALHNLGGGIQYVGGALALLRLADSLGPTFRVAGLLVIAAVVGLSFPNRIRGAIQRVAECCLFGGLLFAIWLQRAVV